MAGARQTLAFLLLQIGRMAHRVARTSVYLAAGTRPIAAMQEDTRRAWQKFYDDHPSPDARLLPWEAAVVDQFVQPGADVLLIGCGSGRDLLPLIERGCRVTGIDPSNTALEIAGRLLADRGHSATLLTGFFEDSPIANSFDVVIFSYYSYAAIPMARRRIAALQKARALLEPGGHVVVSHAAGGARPRPLLVRLARWAGALTRSDWRLEPGDLVWSEPVDRLSISYSHLFENGELEREARAANLTVAVRRVADGAVVAVFART
jgi:SAM-dependent methyltransferase